jgi:hypothetical protein
MSKQTPLNLEEKIAILVTFGFMGAILFWGFTRPNENFSQSLFTEEKLKVETQDGKKKKLAEELITPSDSSLLAKQGKTATIMGEGEKSFTPSYITPNQEQQETKFKSKDDSPITPILPTKTESETRETPQKISENFVDVPETYWAYPFIKALQKQEIIVMTPGQKFNPEGTITRAEYAELIANSFDIEEQREAIQFKDISTDSAQKISRAVKQNFLSGYPDQTFHPNQPITRAHVLLSLVNGLGLTSTANPEEVLVIYKDQNDIPDYAKSAIATATEKGLVVIQPQNRQLNPRQSATRAEVAAMIYQGLVATQGQAKIDSEYLVKP